VSNAMYRSTTIHHKQNVSLSIHYAKELQPAIFAPVAMMDTPLSMGIVMLEPVKFQHQLEQTLFLQLQLQPQLMSIKTVKPFLMEYALNAILDFMWNRLQTNANLLTLDAKVLLQVIYAPAAILAIFYQLETALLILDQPLHHQAPLKLQQQLEQLEQQLHPVILL